MSMCPEVGGGLGDGGKASEKLLWDRKARKYTLESTVFHSPHFPKPPTELVTELKSEVSQNRT